MTAHTPGPWKWWTSNSWRRLKRDDRGITQNVLEPYVSRSDGCPDVTVSEADMGLIAAAPDLLSALKEMLVHFGNPKRDEWMNEEAFVLAQLADKNARAAVVKAETPVSR